MPTAYVVVTYDITDPKTFEAYPPGATPLIKKHGGEVLVADFETQPLEGKGTAVTVVLKFPSEEAARNFYNDPEYSRVKQIRLNSTANGTVVLSKAFQPPAA